MSNSFIDVKGCSSNNINRNLIQFSKKMLIHIYTAVASNFTL